nr:unnamed protein product [Callosobruchus chinensis]
MSNRPISVVELERRRLAMAASLSKDLEASTAWGLKNMVEFNASKTHPERAIRLIGDPALTCHLQLLSHRRRRAVGDLSLFYRYSKGFCSSELTSIIPPLSKPARCTRRTSSSHFKAVVLHISRTERYDLYPQGVQGLEWTAW